MKKAVDRMPGQEVQYLMQRVMELRAEYQEQYRAADLIREVKAS